MLLISLEIIDVGPFRGRHLIELRPLSPQRPIVLVGGANGAGKTTLLEVVRLCLYGRRALGGRVAEAGYEDRLRQLFHVDLAGRASAQMEAALSFEHIHSGARTVYRVRRGWIRRGRRVTEELEVQRDGATLAGTDARRWQDFLYQLLPPALAELSFFDGERIRDLADDAAGLEMASAIRSLLGIDVISRLQDDIRLYMTRQTHQRLDGLDAEITRLNRERTKRAATAEQLDNEMRAAQLDLRVSERKLAAVEDELARRGGTAATRRTELQAQAQQLATSFRVATEELAELCAGPLPLAVAPDLLSRCRRTLETERRHQLETMQAEAARRVAHQLQGAGADPAWVAEANRLGLTLSQFEALCGVLARQLTAGRDTVATIPSLGLRGPEEALDALRAVTSEAARARRVGEHLRELAEQRRKTEEELERAPEPERIEPLLTELRARHAELESLQERIGRLRAELDELASQNRRVDTQLRRLEDGAERMASQEQQTALAARASSALTGFAERLTRSRIGEIESSIQRSLAELLVSPAVARVVIDRHTFAVTLTDAQGRTVERDGLSAGQRQIYAMAFMLGLVRASRRRLPLIIDSPLGRLDATHRHRLAQSYFPTAADQVIVLSTDSEVDADLAAILEPSVSRGFTIEHDAVSRTSSLIEGYLDHSYDTTPLNVGANHAEQEAAAVS